MICECGGEFCYECGGSLQNGMPCNCQPAPVWVAEMSEEAARREDGEDGGEDEDGEVHDDGEDNQFDNSAAEIFMADAIAAALRLTREQILWQTEPMELLEEFTRRDLTLHLERITRHRFAGGEPDLTACPH
jgi:hypothetical protein